jgi:hypothetical protein
VRLHIGSSKDWTQRRTPQKNGRLKTARSCAALLADRNKREITAKKDEERRTVATEITASP